MKSVRGWAGWLHSKWCAGFINENGISCYLSMDKVDQIQDL